MKPCSRFAGGYKDPYFSPSLVPNLEVIYPTVPPLPGQVITGYYVYPGPDSCIVPPLERPINGCGYFFTLVLIIFFWPATCFPMCFGCSYNGYQVPVYR